MIKSANTQYETDLIKLKFIKKKGSVTWINVNKRELKNLLNANMSYSKSYGLFFSNKLNFMIDAELISPIQKYSLAYVDILHNLVETTATC